MYAIRSTANSRYFIHNDGYYYPSKDPSKERVRTWSKPRHARRAARLLQLTHYNVVRLRFSPTPDRW